MIYATITGACHGIGKYILEKSLEKITADQRILILDSDKEALDVLKENKDIIGYHIDLSNVEEIYKFQERFHDNSLSCKHLVNNAGIQCSFDILNPDMKVRDEIFGVNLKAPLLLSSFFAKEFINDKKNEHSIINITSIHDEIIRKIVPYSCSKSALKMLTKELAYQLAKYNIRVNAIAPGSINTPMLRKDLYSDTLMDASAKKIPLGKHGTGVDIANTVLFLQSDEGAYITGTTIVVDGGLSLTL